MSPPKAQVGASRLRRSSDRQVLQNCLGLTLQSPELRQQVFRPCRRLVTIEILVGQEFVAKLRAVSPPNDRLRDLTIQEFLDLLTVRNVFVIFDVVPVR